MVNLAETVQGGVGFSVFKVTGNSIVDTGSKVVSVERDSTLNTDNPAVRIPTLKIEVDQAPNPTLAVDDEVFICYTKSLLRYKLCSNC